MVSPEQRRRRLRLVAILAAVAMLLSVFVGVIAALGGNDDSSTPSADELFDDPDDLDSVDLDVIFYGDSLGAESALHFQAALLEEDPGLTVVAGPIPGLAICDLEEIIPMDLALYGSAEVAVLEFVGNNATPCVMDEHGEPLTGDALADKYAEDAADVTELLVDNEVQVLWVGVPPAPGLPGGASEEIDQAYRDLVDEWDERAPGMVHYAPAAEAVTGPDGEYVVRMECLEDERDPQDVLQMLDELGLDYEQDDLADTDLGCQDDEIQVRSDDEIHLCPAELSDENLVCPTYSSGARRYGEAMAAATLEVLG